MSTVEQVKVGALTYVVKFGACSDTEDWNGVCRYNALQIRINDSMSDRRQGSTLVHEVLHAICDERAVKLTEEQVETLANGMTQVLRDNPDLVEFVTKG